MNSPDVVLLAVGLALPDEARVVLIEEHLTLTALEARRVPLQVGRHAQDELVVDLAATAHALRELATVATETCVINDNVHEISAICCHARAHQHLAD